MFYALARINSAQKMFVFVLLFFMLFAFFKTIAHSSLMRATPTPLSQISRICLRM